VQGQGDASIAVEGWSDEEAVKNRFTQAMNAIEVTPPRTLEHLVWHAIYKWNLDHYNTRDPRQFAEYPKTFAETLVGAALCLEFTYVRKANGRWDQKGCIQAMIYLESWGETRPSHLKVQCVWMQCMFCGALHGIR
jgi:hypothetical protein